MAINYDKIINDLSQEQKVPAEELGKDVFIRAGAGSGKTRTLVDHYVLLLAHGFKPSEIVAITFTRKAAREMRHRINEKMIELISAETDPDVRNYWNNILLEMHNSRIGTIDSLCSEIIRMFPAEAGVDPLFRPLDEAQSTLYMIKAADLAIQQLSTQGKYHQLLINFEEYQLKKILVKILQNTPKVENYLNHRLTPISTLSTMSDLLSVFAPDLISSYRSLLYEDNCLDFDEQQRLAIHILQQSEPQAKINKLIRTVLIDEFQDTDERQRKLIDLLCDSNKSKFLVGDDKQSIYRFRGADVTQFKAAENLISNTFTLQETYRPHDQLLAGIGKILENIMPPKPQADPTYVPYKPLISCRKTPTHMTAPYIEFLMTPGNKPKGGPDTRRQNAAQIVAGRLVKLKESGQIESWDEVMILFRAMSYVGIYEEALENAGIPYITIAGKGFYNRPEIRDVLNMLVTVSNPTDNIAMLGFLTSPVIGFSKNMIAKLSDAVPDSFWDALHDELIVMDTPEDQEKYDRARNILFELEPVAGRIAVSTLIQRIYDMTDYKAYLASDKHERLWRNLDKLLQDARASDIILVSDFLEYISVLNEVGARIGESASDSEGAIQLMTVHKAKGLEAKTIIIGDVGYMFKPKPPEIIISDKYGICLQSDKSGNFPVAWQQEQSDAENENLRLLYVAMTRAKDRLIISGHLYDKGTWAGKLINAIPEIKKHYTQVNTLSSQEIQDPNSGISYLCCYSPNLREKFPKVHAANLQNHNSCLETPVSITDSLIPLVESENDLFDDSENTIGTVIGNLVHKALEMWLFPDNEHLEPMLRKMLFNHMNLSVLEKDTIITHTVELLDHFKHSDIYTEISNADKHWEELPFSVHGKNGYIDKLARYGDKYTIYDYKTDLIESPADIDEIMETYTKQILEYKSVVDQLMGINTDCKLVFLNYYGKVYSVEIKNEPRSD